MCTYIISKCCDQIRKAVRIFFQHRSVYCTCMYYIIFTMVRQYESNHCLTSYMLRTWNLCIVKYNSHSNTTGLICAKWRQSAAGEQHIYVQTIQENMKFRTIYILVKWDTIYFKTITDSNTTGLVCVKWRQSAVRVQWMHVHIIYTLQKWDNTYVIYIYILYVYIYRFIHIYTKTLTQTPLDSMREVKAKCREWTIYVCT